MNRRHALFLLTGATILPAHACLWDRDTLADEIALTPETLDLILGQFPHHGDAYYKLRIARLSKITKPSIEDLNDLAVAHVRLKEFAKAEAHLDSAIKINPTHYETLSNIGVTAKKQSDFKKGATFIKKALAQKPKGHMGLGDSYLKALIWRSKFEKATEANPPENNHLGKAYAASFPKYLGKGKGSKVKNSTTRYHQMVRNDQSFADGFSTLGDYLATKGHLNLAFLSYTRATLLGHQNPAEIERRKHALLTHILMRPNVRNKQDPSFAPIIANAEKKIAAGDTWLTQFKQTEAALLRGKTDEREVTLPIVLKEMERLGIKKAR